MADPTLSNDTRMSLMHASLESALLSILDMRGEQRPFSDAWHVDLIHRVSREITGRPSILPAPMAKAADRPRHFRHVAVRTYDKFNPKEAIFAIEAARAFG